MSVRKSFDDFSVAVYRLDRMLSEQIQSCMQKGGLIDLPSSSAFILLPLLEQDGQTLTELSRHSCLKAPTITVLANRLENLKLVRRQRNYDDKRLVHLFLTNSGREHAHVLESEWRKFTRKLAVGITDEMLQKATATLNVIIKNAYDVID